MEDDKTRLLAEKVPTLALNDPDPAPRLENWAKEYEKLCPGPSLQTR